MILRFAVFIVIATLALISISSSVGAVDQLGDSDIQNNIISKEGMVENSLEGINQSKETDAVLEITVPESDCRLIFKRLPRNNNITPVVNIDESISEPAYQIASVFFAETELTLEQLRCLLTDDGWTSYKSLIKNRMGSKDDPKFGGYIRAVDAVTQDSTEDQQCPVVLANFETIRAVCQRLETIVKDSPEVCSYNNKFAEVTFRLPSTKEWQYAARFTTDIDEARNRKFFPNWIDFQKEENVRLRGQWVDVCQMFGVPVINSPTAEDICGVADTVFQKGRRKEGYNLLGNAICVAMGTPVHITKRDAQCILPVKSMPANLWGFFGLFGNASEWTLEGADGLAVDKNWQALTTDSPEIADSKLVRIMGGQFLNTYPKFEAWKLWSIANGLGPIANNIFTSGKSDGEAFERFVDLKAGVRLCIENKLRKNWFVDYRRNFLQKKLFEENNEIFRAAFRDLCTTVDQLALNEVIDSYEELSKQESLDQIDAVCDITAVLIKAFKKLRSTTEEGRGLLEEEKLEEQDEALAGIDLSMFSGEPGASSVKIEENKSETKEESEVDFFELLQEVNSA